MQAVSKIEREAGSLSIVPIAPRNPAPPPIEDARFRALLPAHEWASLPEAVRRRFSKRVADGATIVYKGRVTLIAYSRAGYALSQLLRAAGAPLPLSRQAGLETVVTVTEDRASRGQFWTRMFARERGFPQMIHSVKRFAGKTGIEEALPFGIVMALRLSVQQGALCFRSAGYELSAGAIRIPLPDFLTPGALLVSHKEIDAHSFLFSMTLRHPLLGTLLHQEAIYVEDAS